MPNFIVTQKYYFRLEEHLTVSLKANLMYIISFVVHGVQQSCSRGRDLRDQDRDRDMGGRDQDRDRGHLN